MGQSTKTLFSVISCIIVFLALQVVSQALVIAGYSLYEGRMTKELSATGLVLSMALFSVSAIIVFYKAGLAPLSRTYLSSRPFGVLSWSVIASVGVIVPAMFVQELMPQWPESIQEYVNQAEAVAAQLMGTRGGYFVICLLAPVAEEMVFRGAVLRQLLEWKPERRWLMIVLSALLFALSHMNPAQFLHPLVIGLLLGWMYERTRSLLPGIVFHWGNNTLAYLLYHAYPDPDITLSDIFSHQTSAVFMAVGFSLLIVLPAIYQLNQRMKRP